MKRRILKSLVLLASFVLVSPVFARSRDARDWSEVKRLETGKAVTVQTREGAVLAGKLLRANETEMWLTTATDARPQHMRKEDVLEVRHAPASCGREVVGAVTGSVIGLFLGPLMGSAIDGDCGGCDDPGLLGAVVGLFVGPPAGAYAGYRIAKADGGRLVYRAPQQKTDRPLWDSDPEEFSRLLESGAIETGLDPVVRRVEAGTGVNALEPDFEKDR